ncbi:hypothetical protein AU255_07490 [Methyloprofundus sedimenti]|uniref:Uncharacterized protein n=1 Tax=Methyloprofundus sedimenti TaxID=1420851 RepID=A0A1V8M7Z6_9GAMM|nr:hypothetical protein [Methyloprofundus sedimenti]OQK17700.1 hypothetical protein AU255_07490 [Methyloprofundus sedimenti]
MQKYKVIEIEVHVGGEDYLINLEGFYIDAMIQAGHPDIEEFLASKIESQGGWLETDVPIEKQARCAIVQTLAESHV